VTKIVTALNLKIPPRNLKSKDTRQLLSLIFMQWLPLSTCIIQAAIDIVPAPSVAQSTRIPKMLYPELQEAILAPKDKLEEDLYAGKAEINSYVTAYVSKMFAVSKKDLPEKKELPLTADGTKAKARAVLPKKQENGLENQLASIEIQSPKQESPVLEEPEEVDEASEVVLGFARLYSGILRVGSIVHALLPKYDPTLESTHPYNQKYIVSATVEGLYIMMGRELNPVDFVRAGNIFAIRGLGGKVYRSATVCAPGRGDVQDGVDPKSWLVNLGAVNRAVSSGFFHMLIEDIEPDTQTPPIVRVALEPAFSADMPKLLTGLKFLSQSDPCVETFQQQTGEHVILTAGELHLEAREFCQASDLAQ